MCSFQYVIIPPRRSTAEAIQILVLHLFGDAGSPWLIGKVTNQSIFYKYYMPNDWQLYFYKGISSTDVKDCDLNSTQDLADISQLPINSECRDKSS